MRNNQLKALAVDAVQPFPNLTMLSLSDNQFTQVPDLRALVKLQSLRMHNNRLTNIDEAAATHIASCPLQMLDLSHNEINAVQPMNGMGRLNALRLNHNKLAAMPKLQLAALRYLQLSHNQIAELNVADLLGMPKLLTLDLRGNPIRALEDDVLAYALQHNLKVMLDEA
jgi:internalin A